MSDSVPARPFTPTDTVRLTLIGDPLEPGATAYLGVPLFGMIAEPVKIRHDLSRRPETVAVWVTSIEMIVRIAAIDEIVTIPDPAVAP